MNRPHFIQPTIIELTADRLRRFWDKATRTISMELSDLTNDANGGYGDYRCVIIRNIDSGKEMTFGFTHRDMDGSQEDTYGWNYQSDNGIKLLLIND